MIPFTARQKAASGLVVSLDALFIEALFEWKRVDAGQLDDDEITKRRRKLMELRYTRKRENSRPAIFPSARIFWH